MGALESLVAGVSAAVGSFRQGQAPFPPQALAETTPSLTNGWFYGQSGIDLVGKHLTYGALYRAQPSVATLVDKRANALARLTLNVWDSTPPTGNILSTGTPLAKLIADPTGGSMSPFAFYRWLSSTYDIYGEVFLLKVRDDAGAIAQLFPMTPARVVVRRGEDGVVYYTFTLGVASAGLLTVPASDVVAFLKYNPDSIMRGMSRLEPLRATLANEDAARRASLSFWTRGARPGMVISHPNELSQKAADRLRVQFDARHAGADNVGGTAVIDEGMTITRMQLDLEEMQYVEGRKLNLQEVCMVFDVPPPVVHILDHATFSNITEQMRSMYRDTMAPHLEDIESTLNAFVCAEFGPTETVRFALDEVLRGDFETRATAVVSLVANGIMKPSEARPLFDLPDAGTISDALYANQALQPLGTPVVRTTVAEAGPTDPTLIQPEQTNEGKSLTRKASAMSGRIAAKASRPDMRSDAVKAQAKAAAAALGRQASAVSDAWDTYGDIDGMDPEDVADGLYAPEDWDEDLADELADPTAAVVDAFGKSVAGKTFDSGAVKAWLAVNVANSAKSMNAATLGRLVGDATAALATDDPNASMTDRMAAFVDYMTGTRVDQVAESRATTLAAFGEREGAQQSGAATKTWVVNSAKPRESHAAMDGEEVGIDETFSNGAAYPGDPSLDVDEIAGCTCTLDFVWPDNTNEN